MLIPAILSKDESRAKALVEEGSLDAHYEVDSKGNTPLIYAVWVGLPGIVAILLKGGANLAATNLMGENALHVCATHGDSVTATILVEAGANLETVGSFDGARPLHMAAQAGNEEVAKVFLDAGAMVDARTSNGQTALYIAASAGQAGVFRLLVRSRATLDFSYNGGPCLLELSAGLQNPEFLTILCDADVVDSKGFALCHAVTTGREESVEVLLQHSSLLLQGISEEKLEIMSFIYVNSARERCTGFSALECCFKETSLKPRILRRLIDAGIDAEQWFGVDVNTKFSDGRFQRMTDAICRAPAVVSVSWGWPRPSEAVEKKATASKKIFLRPRRSTKPRLRVVWAAAFRTKI